MLCYMENFMATARLSRASSNQIPSLFILAVLKSCPFFRVFFVPGLHAPWLLSCSFLYMYLTLSLATCFCISAYFLIFFSFQSFMLLWSESRSVLSDCLQTMDYRIHGILQARILEWVAVPFSRGFSQPRDQTHVSHIAGGFFTSWATRKAPLCSYLIVIYIS